MTTAPDSQLLLVDDDEAFRESLASRLRRRGYEVAACTSGPDALGRLQQASFPLALVDIRMPDMDGITLLKAIKGHDPLVEVVVLTGHATLETAIEAMKLGAYDYLTKPFEPTKLDVIITKALEKWRLARHAQELEGEVARLSQQLRERYSFQNIVGKSVKMQELYERIGAAARSHATVMILGESGTGKELVARAIHYTGPDATKPFVPVNCAALPRELIESELFGHRKGSFTSASGDAPGLFKSAEGGTLFLDEISEMALDTQAKLLRVLQERTVRPVGAAREVPVNVRVITASNRDPAQSVAQGKLREDLYYRLSVATLRIPPLRERMDDVPLLIQHFLQKFGTGPEATITGIDRGALDAMLHYHWPGNVRELENIVEAAFTFGKGPKLTKADLPPELLKEQGPARNAGLPFDGVVSLREAERMLIVRAMGHFHGNKSHVARALGISRKQLYVKLAAYGLHGPPPAVV